MLGGLAAALPVVYGIESASSALAASAPVATAPHPGSVPNLSAGLVHRNGTDELVRFAGRNYKEDDQVDVTAYAVRQLPRLGLEEAEVGDEEDESERCNDEVNQEGVGLWRRGRQ